MERLTANGQRHAFIEATGKRTLADESDGQRRTVVDRGAIADQVQALELTRHLMALAGPALARCDDSSSSASGTFHAACADLGKATKAAKATPLALAAQTSHALLQHAHGQHDDLIAGLTLGAAQRRNDGWSPSNRGGDTGRATGDNPGRQPLGGC